MEGGGLQAATLGADAPTDVVDWGWVGARGGLTSGVPRRGGGVSERTLIRPLGHTR